MSAGNPLYEGVQQSDTPLPTVAARAARKAFAAARPTTFSVAQTAARFAVTATIVASLTGLFTALIASTIH